MVPGRRPRSCSLESSWRSLRAPRPTDSLWSSWRVTRPARTMPGPPRHRSAGAGSCPGSAASRSGAAPPPLDPAVRLGSRRGPARLVEVMQMRYYHRGGKSVRMRSVSTGEAITPVAGPSPTARRACAGLTNLSRRRRCPHRDPAAVRAVRWCCRRHRPADSRRATFRRPLVDSFRSHHPGGAPQRASPVTAPTEMALPLAVLGWW